MNEQLSVASALAEGLQVTVIGLCIVFGVLVLLMFVLMLMKIVFYKDPAKQTATSVGVIGNADASAVMYKAEPINSVSSVPAQETDALNEEELIAVLTAAVAASLNTSTYNLQIKSYRRIGNNSPAWNKAGLNETINNRL